MPKQTFFNLSEEKRNHILDVAVDEFADHGYKSASISRMVATAGIAKGSFYQYFEDLDDLYMYIVSTLIADRKLTAYQEESQKLVDLSLTEFLRVVFHRQVKDFLESPKLLKIGMEMVQLIDQPIYRKFMEKYQGDYNTYFIKFIQHEMDQGEIDSRVNAQLLNFMLVSLGQYLIYRFRSQDDGPTVSETFVDELVDDLEFILANGIYTGISAKEENL